jgi:hypothetical protein
MGVLTARTEGRYIQESPDARTLFKDLAAWYRSMKDLLPFFGTGY